MFSERGHPAAGGLPASRCDELGAASPMTPGGAHNAALCAPPSERLAHGGRSGSRREVPTATRCPRVANQRLRVRSFSPPWPSVTPLPTVQRAIRISSFPAAFRASPLSLRVAAASPRGASPSGSPSAFGCVTRVYTCVESRCAWPEHLLHVTHVGAALEHQRRHRVPEDVARLASCRAPQSFT